MSLNSSSSNTESLEEKIIQRSTHTELLGGVTDGILLQYIQPRRLPFKKYVSTDPSGISDYYDS